ncbi:MAG: MotA/TolQ/ExbB proton channel family protein [Bacteroidetes bacterium]|nr:MotA/TolQ/ExbB proton channel family protein [Bacteroidota bacterium]
MKKVIVLILALGMLFNIDAFAQGNTANNAAAQEEVSENDSNTAAEAPATEEGGEEAPAVKKEAPKKGEGIKVIRDKFIEGGAEFMALPLLCLIFGLAIVIERLITLFSVGTNSNKFVQKVEDALTSGGIESAKDVCRNTRGPIASIFYQGLDRADEGIDMVEKSVISYGGVQMGQLERGLVWISLFIALAPMLGFLGTVIGMIDAFDAIENAGDISPAIVAKGIKVALLTTVAGLIVAIILQIFYNLLVSKIDAIVNNMEDSSIKLVDMLIKNNVVNTKG